MVTLSATEFKEALSTLGWKPKDAAEIFGVSLSTVYRWTSGEIRVPGPVAVALECKLKILRVLG